MCVYYMCVYKINPWGFKPPCRVGKSPQVFALMSSALVVALPSAAPGRPWAHGIGILQGLDDFPTGKVRKVMKVEET